MDIDKEIRGYALQNAIRYNGRANPGSVIGMLLSKHPQLKSKVKEIAQKVNSIVKQINKLPLEAQKQELSQEFPELLEEKHKEREIKLQPLPGAVMGKVVTRAAPNP
ncbi:glutamate--tRNA ligase, partial [Candidatus Woesearchaeota archaeon]|nr:glutamate--tRNA ligase [Candidatus Woesearchaeota archaeon]